MSISALRRLSIFDIFWGAMSIWLDSKFVATKLGYSLRQVNRLARAGKIPHVRRGTDAKGRHLQFVNCQKFLNYLKTGTKYRKHFPTKVEARNRRFRAELRKRRAELKSKHRITKSSKRKMDWPIEWEGFGRFTRFTTWILSHPLETWNQYSRSQLKQDLAPLVLQLWPEAAALITEPPVDLSSLDLDRLRGRGKNAHVAG
jgi:hypothetical protein